MRNNITMQGVRSLYSFTMGGMKMEQLNEGIINLMEVDIRSIIIIVILVIHVLSFKKWFDVHAKYENLTDKIQALEKHTSETNKKFARCGGICL